MTIAAILFRDLINDKLRITYPASSLRSALVQPIERVDDGSCMFDINQMREELFESLRRLPSDQVEACFKRLQRQTYMSLVEYVRESLLINFRNFVFQSRKDEIDPMNWIQRASTRRSSERKIYELFIPEIDHECLRAVYTDFLDVLHSSPSQRYNELLPEKNAESARKVFSTLADSSEAFSRALREYNGSPNCTSELFASFGVIDREMKKLLEGFEEPVYSTAQITQRADGLILELYNSTVAVAHSIARGLQSIFDTGSLHRRSIRDKATRLEYELFFAQLEIDLTQMFDRTPAAAVYQEVQRASFSQIMWSFIDAANDDLDGFTILLQDLLCEYSLVVEDVDMLYALLRTVRQDKSEEEIASALCRACTSLDEYDPVNHQSLTETLDFEIRFSRELLSAGVLTSEIGALQQCSAARHAFAAGIPMSLEQIRLLVSVQGDLSEFDT